MKKRSLYFLLALIMCTVAFFTACKEAPAVVTLNIYSKAFELHTPLQIAYLSEDNPAALDTTVNGMQELSRPVPVKLEWQDSKPVSNYVVTISENSDMSDPRKVFTDKLSCEVYNLKVNTKYYWTVKRNVPDGGTSDIGTFLTGNGPRNIYLDGVTNVRDLGGWISGINGTIVQGIIYRGGRLNNSYPEGYNQDKKIRDKYCIYEREITREGEKVFTEVMKIKTEIDLRALNGNGYPEAADGSEAYEVNVEGVNYVNVPMDGSADINDNKAGIKALFDILKDKNNYPIYYHCNIGTDRTGMVSYILAALCGAYEEDLYRDYMFSNFGTIALARMAWNQTDRSRVELTKLTENKGSSGNSEAGTAYRISKYDGDTLVEKVENCLKDCGVTEDVYNAVRDILLGRI